MVKINHEPGSAKSLKAGILWQSKLDYGKDIYKILSLWIAAQFIVQLFSHPGFVLAFGCIYSLIIGLKAGGNEVADCAEEFSFSLTPPRGLRYRCKYLYGVKPLLLILILSLLTIYFNLSQVFWSLFIETGLNNPYRPEGALPFWYILAFLMPLALYTAVFGNTINTYSRRSLNSSVFSAIGVCGASAVVIAVIFKKMERAFTNVSTILVLILLIGFTIIYTYKKYCLKEGISLSKPPSTAQSTLGTLIIIIFTFIIIFSSFLFLTMR